jgi:hypothetical protein
MYVRGYAAAAAADAGWMGKGEKQWETARVKMGLDI